MIDHVFYNPVENYSRGHPLYPSEISTIEPPHPLGISIDHLWGGGGMDIFWNHTLQRLTKQRSEVERKGQKAIGKRKNIY